MASSRQIERTAAAWLTRRNGEGWCPQDQNGLDAWLLESTAHRVAFLRLDAAWEHSGRLKALGAGAQAGAIPPRGQWSRSPFDSSEHANGNTATIVADDVVTPAGRAGEPPDLRGVAFAARTPPPAPRLARLAGVAAAVLVAVTVGWGWQRQASMEQASYLTTIGDLLTVPLSDGSNATLSSDSRMRVALSNGERRIELDQGEAFFEVAKDPGRPFVVSVDGRQVVAVGTRFAVRRDGADLRVVVTEGTVRLQSDSSNAPQRTPTALLQAGSVALASRQGLLVRTGTVEDAERQLDWRGGYVTFRDTPLEDAAAEFNRYNTRKIVIGDSAVAAMRVGGNFRWSNTEAFVRLLEQAFPVRAEAHPDRIVLHSR
ncbi:MAG TPA: FecR domain-containing protein [Pseudoxanthomonas sp.]|nr:FecR domain-containing protein [Pseudoxanthomonas sp.]